jgi:hypothetical protein
MIHKWCAKISWWAGSLAKPRSNMKVRVRVIRFKTIDELAKRLARSRYKAVELLGTGGRVDPGGFYTRMLVDRIDHYRAEKKRLTMR